MIGKLWQRLVKETLISLYHDKRTSFCKHFPVYYFAFDGNIERVGLAVQSLQQIPQIPWPDDNCIILAEDVALSLLTDDPNVRGLVWVVYTKNFRTMLGHPGDSEIFYAGATYLFGNRIVKNPGQIHYIEHVNDPKSRYKRFVNPEDSRNRAINTILKACEQFGISASPESYGEYLDAVLVSDMRNHPHWIAFQQSQKKMPQPGLAADLLAYLANLAVPCHYMMKSKPQKGFGPTGEIRRLTSEKPIFTVISHNRLHRAGQNGEGQSPRGHDRDGHIRHLWKKGIPPLDRFALPANPTERIKLVFSHQVPRVYIHPTWVGERTFENGGFGFEVMTGEMPLNPLNRKIH